ncbi:hypothetical protein ACN28S_67565 [Cystobacter fuscus]
MKGCHRSTRRFANGALFFEAAGTHSVPATRTSTRIATPAPMEEAYTEMLTRVPNLRPAPTLEFYDDLHGFGGLFMAEPWVVAVGQKDIETIADQLLSTRHLEVARVARELGAARNVNVTSIRTVLLGSAMARCIAHELGHAMLYCGFHNPYAPDEEAGADYYAGRLDASRRIDWRLGEMFFRSIGCVGPTCTHPTPANRSSAYVTGYNEQYSKAA